MHGIFLVGPTASGKSRIALCVAKKLPGEIVNMDSMQIFDSMRIGSARPSPQDMEMVPHHLYGAIPIGTEFSAASYKERALKTMADIIDRGKTPILCGGTGLYLNAMTYRMDFGGAGSDVAVRQMLQHRLECEGGEALHRELCTVDPVSAARLHPNDHRRVMRALEVFQITGFPISSGGEGFRKMEEEAYDFLIFGITMPREVLYRRINRRVEEMLQNGLLDECREILGRGIPLDHPSMMGIGYRQVYPYLLGKCGYEEMVERIKQETRRYAKRQLTWFRRDRRIIWLNREDYLKEDDLTDKILSIIKEKTINWRDFCDKQSDDRIAGCVSKPGTQGSDPRTH